MDHAPRVLTCWAGCMAEAQLTLAHTLYVHGYTCSNNSSVHALMCASGRHAEMARRCGSPSDATESILSAQRVSVSVHTAGIRAADGPQASASSLSNWYTPRPLPTRRSCDTYSDTCLTDSTCSSSSWPSRKSLMLASSCLAATACSSRSLVKLSFSSDRASSMAYNASPLASLANSISGIRMFFSTTRPPRLFWYSISSSACPRSSKLPSLKNLARPGSATLSRSK
mmetsp:Transcript_5647/g.13019  ORF Transcript_5647/g.13019 Transcript_5647/m.13019 type:complete len:227 (-) Transcript_5647:49-729(-)